MKTKQNQKVFCKRHYPVRFAIWRAMVFTSDTIIPWVIVSVLCALVAWAFVEIATGGVK